MGVTTFTEVTFSIAPEKNFERDNPRPKLPPQEIKSTIESVHGNGEVGIIKQTNFAEVPLFKCMKHRLDAIDETNYIFKHTLIVGDASVDKLEKVGHEVKIETGGAGCVVKSTIHFHTKGDIVIPEELKARKEKVL